jgi:hypothetical protein
LAGTPPSGVSLFGATPRRISSGCYSRHPASVPAHRSTPVEGGRASGLVFAPERLVRDFPAQSGFHSALRDPIPRCETLQAFCHSLGAFICGASPICRRWARPLLNKRNKIGNRNSNSFARAGNTPPVVGKNMNTPSVGKKNNRPADNKNTPPEDKKDTHLADMNTQPADNKRARAGSKPGRVGSNTDYSRGEKAPNQGRKNPALARQRHQRQSHRRPHANPNPHLHLRAAAPPSIRSR